MGQKSQTFHQRYFYIFFFGRLTDRQMEKLLIEQMYILSDEFFTKMNLASMKKVPQKFMFLYVYICAFCSVTNRLTDKLFIEKKLIEERNLHRKNQSYVLDRGREIPFLPKPDGHLQLQSSFSTEKKEQNQLKQV